VISNESLKLPILSFFFFVFLFDNWSDFVMYLQLGTFMNTLKRMMDVLHCWVEEIMRPWAPLLTVSDEISPFGEHMNSISVVLKQKYKKYIQAVVKKLLSNVSIQFLPVV
jgi:hypothetical protein